MLWVDPSCVFSYLGTVKVAEVRATTDNLKSSWYFFEVVFFETSGKEIDFQIDSIFLIQQNNIHASLIIISIKTIIH